MCYEDVGTVPGHRCGPGVVQGCLYGLEAPAWPRGASTELKFWRFILTQIPKGRRLATRPQQTTTGSESSLLGLQSGRLRSYFPTSYTALDETLRSENQLRNAPSRSDRRPPLILCLPAPTLSSGRCRVRGGKRCLEVAVPGSLLPAPCSEAWINRMHDHPVGDRLLNGPRLFIQRKPGQR